MRYYCICELDHKYFISVTFIEKYAAAFVTMTGLALVYFITAVNTKIRYIDMNHIQIYLHVITFNFGCTGLL